MNDKKEMNEFLPIPFYHIDANRADLSQSMDVGKVEGKRARENGIKGNKHSKMRD